MTTLFARVFAITLAGVLVIAILITACGDPDIAVEPDPPAETPTAVSSPIPTRVHSDVPDTEAQIIHDAMLGIVRIRTDDSGGSGFAVERSGDSALIVTSAHVIEESSWISIITPDGVEYPATVAHVDVEMDIAVLTVPGAAFLPILQFADSSQLQVTDKLYVVGFALAFDLLGDPTVTSGILSGWRVVRGVEYLQTDAVMNPGNSGGPVLNVRGEVVGIATWGMRSTDSIDLEGLNFAVPAGTAEMVLEEVP
jgi:S1-C subfamily serine protease